MTVQHPSGRGGRRPDLAADFAVTVAAARAHAARACVSFADAVAAAAALLEHRAHTTVAAEPPPPLVELLTVVFPDVPVARSGDGAADAVPVQVARVVADGADGERLFSAVLGLEACRHIPLVWHQANKLVRSFPEYTADDLVGWGWHGLRTALRVYDPSRFAFSTYACTRIAGSIRDGVRAENPVPKRLATDVRKLQRAEEELTVELLRPPTLAEVVDRVGFSADHAQLLARCRPAASIDELTALDDAERTPAWLGVTGGQEAAAAASELRAVVAAAVAELPEEEAEAVRLLVLEETPLAVAAQQAGVSAAKLRRRRDRALDRLAPALAAWAD